MEDKLIKLIWNFEKIQKICFTNMSALH